MFNVKLPA